jgi:hypothetical protein
VNVLRWLQGLWRGAAGTIEAEERKRWGIANMPDGSHQHCYFPAEIMRDYAGRDKNIRDLMWASKLTGGVVRVYRCQCGLNYSKVCAEDGSWSLPTF